MDGAHLGVSLERVVGGELSADAVGGLGALQARPPCEEETTRSRSRIDASPDADEPRTGRLRARGPHGPRAGRRDGEDVDCVRFLDGGRAAPRRRAARAAGAAAAAVGGRRHERRAGGLTPAGRGAATSSVGLRSLLRRPPLSESATRRTAPLPPAPPLGVATRCTPSPSFSAPPSRVTVSTLRASGSAALSSGASASAASSRAPLGSIGARQPAPLPMRDEASPRARRSRPPPPPPPLPPPPPSAARRSRRVLSRGDATVGGRPVAVARSSLAARRKDARRDMQDVRRDGGAVEAAAAAADVSGGRSAARRGSPPSALRRYDPAASAAAAARRRWRRPRRPARRAVSEPPSRAPRLRDRPLR